MIETASQENTSRLKIKFVSVLRTKVRLTCTSKKI